MLIRNILNGSVGPQIFFAPDGDEGVATAAETQAAAQSTDSVAGGGGEETVAGGGGADSLAGGADGTAAAAAAAAKPVLAPWAQRRIDELTRDKRDLQRQLDSRTTEERLLADAAVAARADTTGGAAGGAAAMQPTRATAASKIFTEADVEAEAERRLMQRNFNDRCNKINEDGEAKHGKDAWTRSLTNFSHIGGLLSDKTLPLMAAVMESENGPDILFALGNDLDRATELLEMSPIKLAREITKMDIEVGKPKKPSGAPEPAPKVGGGSSGAANKDPENMTDDEWSAWRAKDLADKRKNGLPTPRI